MATKNSLHQKLIWYVLDSEIRFRKFSNDLEKIGLDGSIITVGYEDPIFKFFGIKMSEQRFNRYLILLDDLTQSVDLTKNKSVDQAVLNLYQNLKKRTLNS